MMVETYLLRGKRQLGRWLSVPWFRALSIHLCYGIGGFLLSGAAVWGTMQPIAMGLAAGSRGLSSCAAAAGSLLGYRLFWGRDGYQGVIWSLGGMLIALLLPFFGDSAHAKPRLGGCCAALVCASGLVFRFRMADPTPTGIYLFRILLAPVCAMVCGRILAGRNRAAQWVGAGILVLALTSVPFLRYAGFALAGAIAAAAPLPGAALAGLAADISASTLLPITAVLCLSYFAQSLPIRDSRRRMAAPALACGAVMLLTGIRDFPVLAAVSLGGVAGAAIPWRISAVPRHGSLGYAQVQLEQTGQVFLLLQRQLLEYSPAPPDVSALLEQTRQQVCVPCPHASSCREQDRLTEAAITGSALFPCRKAAALNAQLQSCRDQLKRMKASRAMQEEYRTALVQQYALTADMLRCLSDRLPERELKTAPRFRVLVSSRSRSREIADGDRVLAFPGSFCRYYVLLCDGMGTGLGAAEEGRQAGSLLQKMLTAGLPPAGALGCLNSQLTLLGRGGSVSVDLTELHLDRGTALVYKWGGSPGILFSRGRASPVGYPTPPPGMDISESRECSQRVNLRRGQTLIMTSDGISTVNAPYWARDADTAEPGILAERILREGGSREDDATAVVIRLVPRTHAPTPV